MTNNKTILVVDDQEDIRLMLSTYLQEKNYIVINAPSAEVSLRLLKEFKVDLLITDLVMPGMNGLEFIKYLVYSLEKEDMPKIMVYSGYNDMLANDPNFKYVNKVVDKLDDMKEVIKQIIELIEEK